MEPNHNPVTQHTPALEPAPVSTTTKTNQPIIIILITLLVIASVIATYYYTKSLYTNQIPIPNNSQTPISTPTSQATDQTTSTPSPTDDINLSTFSDPQLQNTSFKYDTQTWQVSKIYTQLKSPKHSTTYQGPGLYLNSLVDDGEIFISYTLQFGRGGSIVPFSQSDYTQINNKLTRIKFITPYATTYTYGLDQNVLLFQKQPQELEEIKATCALYMAPNYQGYQGLSIEQCQDILDGQTIGYYTDPTFIWSLNKVRLAPLNEFSSIWAEYEKNLDIDNDTITLEIRYYGSNPELADTIITQLF